MPTEEIPSAEDTLAFWMQCWTERRADSFSSHTKGELSKYTIWYQNLMLCSTGDLLVYEFESLMRSEERCIEHWRDYARNSQPSFLEFCKHNHNRALRAGELKADGSIEEALQLTESIINSTKLLFKCTRCYGQGMQQLSVSELDVCFFCQGSGLALVLGKGVTWSIPQR